MNREQCGGRPCVRGLRIRVTDVLDLLASGLSPEPVGVHRGVGVWRSIPTAYLTAESVFR